MNDKWIDWKWIWKEFKNWLDKQPVDIDWEKQQQAIKRLVKRELKRCGYE